MARYGLSAIFSWVRGSIGGLTFAFHRGVPYVRVRKKRYRDAKTKYQVRVRQIFALLDEEWHNLSLSEVALWEDYAKRGVKTALDSKSWKGRGDGLNAFIAINHPLLLSGFSLLRKPPSDYLPKPPVPATDLMDMGTYEREARFKVWLPHDYSSRCVCHIWVRPVGYSPVYISSIVAVTTHPTEVLIDKIRVKERGRTVEKKLSSIKLARLRLQLRVVSENGKFSLPSSIYRIEIRNIK